MKYLSESQKRQVEEIAQMKTGKIIKQISKQEASENYGVITTGINSLYRYYLTENGFIVDSDGDIRYIPKAVKV